MRASRLLGAFLVGGLAWGASATAEAKPLGDSLEKSRPSFYLYGAPLFFAAPIGDEDVTDLVNVSYQWGFGLGGLFALGPKRRFGLGVGFGFEHNPASLDRDFDDLCDAFDSDCGIHAFRFLPEVRLGGIFNQLFVYGYVAPGIGVVHYRFPNNLFRDDTDTDLGFNFGTGGGAQYVVWKGLFVGGELGFDLGFYPNGEDDFTNNDYGIYLFDFKALVGYYF